MNLLDCKLSSINDLERVRIQRVVSGGCRRCRLAFRCNDGHAVFLYHGIRLETKLCWSHLCGPMAVPVVWHQIFDFSFDKSGLVVYSIISGIVCAFLRLPEPMRAMFRSVDER